MSNKDGVSKFLSLILRHKPEEIGIQLDQHGWANVAELISKMGENGTILTMGKLENIVETDSKGRYSFNHDKTLIRANQGHSIKVDLELKPVEPPEVLYHGTADRFIDSIMKSGLKPISRNHVHLSSDIETALKVGKRHGKAIILTINAQEMALKGHKFYISTNGVWLTDAVPTEFIEVTKLGS